MATAFHYKINKKSAKSYATHFLQMVGFFLFLLGFTVVFQFDLLALNYFHYVLPASIVFLILVAPFFSKLLETFLFSKVTLCLDEQGMRTTDMAKYVGEFVSKKWTHIDSINVICNEADPTEQLAFIFMSSDHKKPIYSLDFAHWDVIDHEALLHFIKQRGLSVNYEHIDVTPLPEFTENIGDDAGRYAWCSVLLACAAFLLRYLDTFFTVESGKIILLFMVLSPLMMAVCFFSLKNKSQHSFIPRMMVAGLFGLTLPIFLYSVVLYASPLLATDVRQERYRLVSGVNEPIRWQSETSGYGVYCRFPALVQASSSKTPITQSVEKITVWGMTRINRENLCTYK